MGGWLVFLLSPSYRRHLRENMAQAGVAGMRSGAVVAAGKTMSELPKLWMRSREELMSRVANVYGMELVEAARRSGRGILFLTPHLGSFEMAVQYCGLLVPTTVLYRRPKQSWFRPIVEQGRGTHVKLAPADLGGVRRLLKGLRTSEAVIVLPDQVPSFGEGVWECFFGRPAYTMTLASRLAQSDVAVVLMYAERLPFGAGYNMHFMTPTGDVATPAGISREIEKVILRCPEQYLWGYNRYKGYPATP
jgi:KDO2-lipid IV(A) lauroyltransferase